MPTFGALKGEYARLWSSMTIRQDKRAEADSVARKILAGKDRYAAVEAATGVPWKVVGIIHTMECGLSFKGHLHNGDPLTARTKQVPKGRPTAGGPPFSWEESAIDAMRYDGLDKVDDWSPESIAFELEGYNGWGYRTYHPTVLSPYLWSYSTHYTKGKYVADGHWDANAVSGQCGAMVLLARLNALEAAPPAPPKMDTTTTTVVAAAAVSGTVAAVHWWDSIASFFTSLVGG